MLLDGKKALVTGASRGVGAEIAIGLAEQGADVAITDLASQSDDLAKVQAAIEATGRTCYNHALDGTSKPAIEDVFAAVTEASGGIYFH